LALALRLGREDLDWWRLLGHGEDVVLFVLAPDKLVDAVGAGGSTAPETSVIVLVNHIVEGLGPGLNLFEASLAVGKLARGENALALISDIGEHPIPAGETGVVGELGDVVPGEEGLRSGVLVGAGSGWSGSGGRSGDGHWSRRRRRLRLIVCLLLRLVLRSRLECLRGEDEEVLREECLVEGGSRRGVLRTVERGGGGSGVGV